MKSSTPTLKFNLPTALTLSRLFVIPVFLLVAPGYPLPGAIVFTLASMTDWLDGYLARKMGCITKFGIIMDPIADKFLVISALVLLVKLEEVSVWIAAVLIAREFLVTAIRVVALSKGTIIPAEMGGKIKTVFQFCAIVSLVMDGGNYGSFHDIGTALIWVALGLSVFSGVKYTVSFWRTTA